MGDIRVQVQGRDPVHLSPDEVLLLSRSLWRMGEAKENPSAIPLSITLLEARRNAGRAQMTTDDAPIVRDALARIEATEGLSGGLATLNEHVQQSAR